jgi:hypothetical protein
MKTAREFPKCAFDSTAAQQAACDSKRGWHRGFRCQTRGGATETEAKENERETKTSQRLSRSPRRMSLVTSRRRRRQIECDEAVAVAGVSTRCAFVMAQRRLAKQGSRQSKLRGTTLGERQQRRTRESSAPLSYQSAQTLRQWQQRSFCDSTLRRRPRCCRTRLTRRL